MIKGSISCGFSAALDTGKDTGMKIKKKTGIAAALAAVLLLAGCGEETQQPQTEITTVPASYTVRFIMGDEVVYQEQVEEGDSVSAMPTIASAEYTVENWLDEAGNPVSPQETPVEKDCDYTAEIYPNFRTHTAYLFVDENGDIRPDAVLTGKELTQAMAALAPNEEVLSAMALPSGGSAMTRHLLHTLLEDFFPADKLDAAMEPVAEGDVTRAAFACMMNTLLGWDSGETVTLEEGYTIPADLALNREDAADVLEAGLPHREDPAGQTALETILTGCWEPGFTNQAGWLYYADENGALLRNGQLGTLTFDENGCYTSGDKELDAIVAELVEGFIREDPEAERFDVLYTAFLYCRDNFQYVNRGLLDAGATGWEAEKALEMFRSGAGNCYNYAAIFWALSRGLGYDAYCVSGYTTEEYDPHGWVEIELEDGLYIFDTELAMAYLRDGKNYEATFKMPYALAVMWPYYWP